MLEILKTFYSLDWVASLLTLLGMIYIGNKKRIGFIIAIVSNIIWIIFAIKMHSDGMVFLNIILAVIYIRSYIQWGKN